MNTFAYCARSFRRLVARAAGASPTLCPPTTMETFDLDLLAGRDLVWLKLHGIEGERYWYGDNFTTALSAAQLAQADLEGAVVFVSNCWLCDDDCDPGPMLLALAQARPQAIIGGPGTNYALPDRLGGADLLGLYIRAFLAAGFAAYTALRLAKLPFLFNPSDLVSRDVLAFRAWRPIDVLHRAVLHLAGTSANRDARASQTPSPSDTQTAQADKGSQGDSNASPDPS